MTEQVLSVCWKEHTSELATVYKSLLENNFLVDCTISAEGRSLKAHRLVLSACSPYFHMLFCEETGVHPFVILLNVSFETLKAVIDFVYQGETQIPEGNLEGFLSLAQALKIKGLNEFTQDYTNRNLSRNTNGNTPRESTESNQDTCEVQCISVNEESHLNTGHTHSSVPSEPHNSSSEEEQSASVMPPLQELQTSIKQEPLFPEFTATNERLDGVKSNETVPPNCTSGMNEEAFVFSEQDLNQYSSCGVSSRGNVKSSMITRSQQQHMQLSNEVSSGRDVEQLQPLSPVMLVPKREQMDYTETEEPLDEYDVPGNEKNEIDERMEHPSSEQNVNHWSSADGPPLEKDLATQRRSLRGQQSKSSPPHTELQLQEDLLGVSVKLEPTLVEKDGMTMGQLPNPVINKRGRPRKGPFKCEVCHKVIRCESQLARHARTHTGERPFKCETCGRSFSLKGNLTSHMLTHTKERPFRCELCGQGFSQPATLDGHLRRHTGERPFKCEICGRSFALKGNLSSHMFTHTKERPYCCELCGQGFSQPATLDRHLRRHTGERPYHCDVCGKGFAQTGTLVGHMRSHTGERPFVCVVCGKSFAFKGNLASHVRIHTGERPYGCDICGRTFTEKGNLNSHKRTHTGERPFRCDVCGKTFAYSNNLATHVRNHKKKPKYCCDVCGKHFRHRASFTSHKLSHTVMPQR